MSDACIFCKIIRRELSSSIVYEDERIIAFLDIMPVREGHTLVVPKRHSRDLFIIDQEDLVQLIQAAQHIARGIVSHLSADGCNVSFNIGSAAGQSVFHTHIHIIPRSHGDGLSLWPQRSYADGEKDALAHELREVLQGDTTSSV